MLDSSQLTLFEPKVTTSEIRHDLFNHLIKQYLPKVIATLKEKTVPEITVTFTDDGVFFRKVIGEETKNGHWWDVLFTKHIKNPYIKNADDKKLSYTKAKTFLSNCVNSLTLEEIVICAGNVPNLCTADLINNWLITNYFNIFNFDNACSLNEYIAKNILDEFALYWSLHFDKLINFFQNHCHKPHTPECLTAIYCPFDYYHVYYNNFGTYNLPVINAFLNKTIKFNAAYFPDVIDDGFLTCLFSLFTVKMRLTVPIEYLNRLFDVDVWFDEPISNCWDDVVINTHLKYKLCFKEFDNESDKKAANNVKKQLQHSAKKRKFVNKLQDLGVKIEYRK